MSEVTPALTPKEWAAKEAEVSSWLRIAVLQDGLLAVSVAPDDAHANDGESSPIHMATVGYAERPHALAALALHGQPFGFTWEDVDELRSGAELDEDNASGHLAGPFTSPLRAIADRIAALLPPRGAG